MKRYRSLYAVVGFGQLGRGRTPQNCCLRNEGQYDLSLVVSYLPSASISAIRYAFTNILVGCDTSHTTHKPDLSTCAMEGRRKSVEGGPGFPFEVPMTPTLSSLDTSGQPTSPDRISIRGESLSPASSSSSSIPELAARASSSSPISQAARDADAKSSALKALAGISKVVSKSRQVDAEALQAIKAQRAKVKAGVGQTSAHQHSRTMSTESVPSLSEHSSSSVPQSTSSGGNGGASGSVSSSAMLQGSRAHRRSHSGIPQAAAYGSPLTPTSTSPQTYSDILSCMSLADLLALQCAVESEIQKQLQSAGLISCASTSSQSPPQSPAEAIISAQYAAAVFATQQQQQHQHLTASAIAMQQTLAGVGIEHMQMGGSNSGSTSGSRAHSPLGRSPRKGSRAGSCHSRSHSTDTVLRHCSPGGDSVLGAAAMLGPSANSNLSLGLEGFNMNLAGLGGEGMPQAPPTARSLDVGAPQPPQPTTTAFNSSDFSFLSDFQPKMDQAGGSHLGGGAHLGISGHLLAPQGVPVNSPFMHSPGAISPHAMHHHPMMGEHHQLQQHQHQQQRSPSPPSSPQHHLSDLQHQQQQQQLSSLFANLQLGGLDPWQ